jgi:hypothetical protein
MSDPILWLPVRDVATASPDTDYAALQTQPGDGWAFVPEHRPGAGPPIAGIMIRYAWIDSGGLVIAGRGSIHTRLVQRSRTDGCIFDSAALANAVAHRVYVVSGIRGSDQFIPAVDAFISTPATAAGVRFYYRIF